MTLTLSLVILVLAANQAPIWETGGKLAHDRVVQVASWLLAANICHLIATSCYYLAGYRDNSGNGGYSINIRRCSETISC